MHSPITALTWEIWRRGRRSVQLALGCILTCALFNLAIPGWSNSSSYEAFNALLGLCMVVSFLLLMGAFNYTEFNATKDWNGFPYRLFVLPLRTWQLVSLPMLLGVTSVELLYFAWIKLVWNHQGIATPGWFAVVLGAYVVFYQSTLWSLAAFRIVRVIALSFGGVSGVAVACLPIYAKENPSPWFSEKYLTAIMLGLALVAFLVAWGVVARQRCGGGRRRNWIKTLSDWMVDALPRRTSNFSSREAAQFWFEWRRVGWLLPVCTAFVLLGIFAPISWSYRSDPHYNYTYYILIRLLFMPFVLAFAIGKGFIKPDFWSANLSLPTFIAVKPLTCGEFVISKMKVAALSAAITWLLVAGFIACWLSLWANTTDLKPLLYQLSMMYPHSWQMIVVLSFAAFTVITWRCLVSGLWVGLSGKRSHYFGSLCLQAVVPVLALLALGIWSESLDRQIKLHPIRMQSIFLSAIGWALALAVIFKMWLAVFSWKQISNHRARQYLLLWSSATLAFVALGILCAPPFDTYRQEHLYVLGALLVFPLARLGFTPRALAGNRHR